MTDLLTRLEQAESGSRELDAEVLQVMGWKPQGNGDWRAPKGYLCNAAAVPWPTRNVDHALELVPEGWASADLTWFNSTPQKCVARLGRTGFGWIAIGEGKTPALACCVSVLSALKAQEGEKG